MANKDFTSNKTTKEACKVAPATSKGVNQHPKFTRYQHPIVSS